jgi:2,5-diamino-6-(ribosylamino)-4(3H)-pyrimidinone 5'-phosphate reductase
VVVHVAVSLDGHPTGFTVDLARFYSLLPTWQEDITLTGADTILAQQGLRLLVWCPASSGDFSATGRRAARTGAHPDGIASTSARR